MANFRGSMGFIIKKTTTNKNGKSKSVSLEIDPTKIDDELEALKKVGLINDAKDLVSYAEGLGISMDDDEPPSIESTTETITSTTSSLHLLLSELIDQYCEDCIAEGSWSENTAKSNRQSLDTLLFLIGDRTCISIDRKVARETRDKLKKYPTNRNKRKQYNGLSIDQIVKLDIADTISPRTIQKNLTTYSSMFIWAVREGIVTKNPIEDITLNDPVPASEKRHPFDTTDLTNIFSSTLYTDHDYDHHFKFFTPLIALFSGARLAEIAQLELDDIRELSGIYVFDINIEAIDNKTEKRTKNPQSIRQIPIHPKLIELGLIKYRDKLKEAGETRLFPELTLDSRGAYSRKISEWFNPEYLPSVNVNTEKKKFHCFRSTLANELEDVGASQEIIQQLTGHKTNQTVLRKYYLMPNKAQLLTQWLDKLRFDIVLKNIKPYES